LAGRSTSPKLAKHALQKGCPVAAAIRTPRFIAPHRRAARAERYGQTQSSQRGRHLSATPWTPVYAPGRAKRQCHSVTDPIAGNRGLIRPRSCRGGAALTWEGWASGKIAVAGALPCALTSADEARGDPRRLQHRERPHAAMAPDQHHGGWSGSRWFCRSTVSLSSMTSREKWTDRIVPALPADGQRLARTSRIGTTFLSTGRPNVA
jgi:hypothetical protein